MAPEAFVPGYLVYLLFIFLPGIGFGELLGIWRNIDVLSDKFALAFGLGISVDTLVMLIRTAKIDGLVGINIDTVYFVIALGFVALLASLAIRRKFSFPSRPGGIDLALLALILELGGVMLLYFQKFPIFPQSNSQDFANHVNYVLGLISGSTTSIPQGLLYFGVHYQLSAAYLLVGGQALITLQRTMALLIVLSPLLFYYAAKKIFANNSTVGLIMALIYVLSGTIWYTGPIDAGLYPNFFGFLAAMFVLVSFVLVTQNLKSLPYWILFVLALVNGYMSHYTFVTLLPALLLLPVVEYLFSLKSRSSKTESRVPTSLIPALVAILPVAVPFLIYPSIGRYALFLAESGGGVISGATLLSNALSSFPFAHYLAVEVDDDVALIALVLLSIFSVYKGIVRSRPTVFVSVIWFFAIALTSPSDTSAWRFSYEAVVPLTLLASYGLYELGLSVLGTGEGKAGTMTARMKRRTRDPLQFRALVVVLIALGAIIIGSAGTQAMAGTLSSTSTVSQTQVDVYKAIYWLQSNTPNDSRYLSVSDWRFLYTSTMIDRETVYSLESNVSDAISYAKNISAQYIIVTNLVTAVIPNVPDLFPWNNFPIASDSNLTLIFTNPDVRIYQIVA